MNSGVCDEINIEEWISVRIQDSEEREMVVARQLPESPWLPCVEWCEERFGYATRDREIVWCYNGEGWFEFQREEDAIMFILRWS
jgi:hypothetical protein